MPEARERRFEYDFNRRGRSYRSRTAEGQQQAAAAHSAPGLPSVLLDQQHHTAAETGHSRFQICPGSLSSRILLLAVGPELDSFSGAVVIRTQAWSYAQAA